MSDNVAAKPASRQESLADEKTLNSGEPALSVPKSDRLDPEKDTPPVLPGSDAPDGGSAAWLVVLGATCVSFCSFGWLNSVGVFQEYYQNDMLSNYSPSTIAWIPSLQIFFMMGSGPIVGQLFDHYGPRGLILVGSLLHVFGIMMASLGTKYYQIMLAQGICSAIGVAAIFQPSLNVLHGWFNVKKGAAFGIVATGSSLGGIILPIMVTQLIPKVGVGWAMRINAFLLLGLLIIANLTIRARHPPRPQKLSPAQLRRPFTEIKFILLLLGILFFTFGMFVPLNYLPSSAVVAGMSPHLLQYLVPILNAGSLFGRLGSGLYADKLGRYNVFVIVCYFTGIWILALWLTDTSEAGLVAFAVLFGFFSGAYVTLIGPLVASISPFNEIGFRTGIVFFVASIGGLTTNPISGAIIDSSGGWVGMKVYAGVLCLVGTTFVLASRIYSTGWKLLVVF